MIFGFLLLYPYLCLISIICISIAGFIYRNIFSESQTSRAVFIAMFIVTTYPVHHLSTGYLGGGETLPLWAVAIYIGNIDLELTNFFFPVTLSHSRIDWIDASLGLFNSFLWIIFATLNIMKYRRAN